MKLPKNPTTRKLQSIVPPIVPTSSIDWLEGYRHVSESYSDVVLDIMRRIEQHNPEPRIIAYSVVYALIAHAENRADFEHFRF
jgi:hypothetical protein